MVCDFPSAEMPCRPSACEEVPTSQKMEPTNLVVVRGVVVTGIFGTIRVTGAQLFYGLNQLLIKVSIYDQSLYFLFFTHTRLAGSG